MDRPDILMTTYTHVMDVVQITSKDMNRSNRQEMDWAIEMNLFHRMFNTEARRVSQQWRTPIAEDLMEGGDE